MAIYGPKNIRNIILMAHSGAGKTSFGEGLLYNAGAVSSMGSIDSGTTISDYNDDERQRKSSINFSILTFPFQDVKINLIDTPGYAEFIGEVMGALVAVESAILLIDATSGIEIGTEQFWKLAKDWKLPTTIFINKMDSEHADFQKCLEAIKKKFGRSAAAISYPIGKGSNFSGVIDLLTKEGLDKAQEHEKKEAEKLSSELVESVAEQDDALLEKYLEGKQLSSDEVKGSLRRSILERKIIPVLAGSATHNLGLKEALIAILEYLPQAAERPPVAATDGSTDEELELGIATDLPFSAQVFKTIFDPYVGQISVIKIFSGKLSPNSDFLNVTKSSKERVGQLFMLNGKSQTQISEAFAGDIVALLKLKVTQTNDSLSSEKRPLKFQDIIFPEPAISFSIKPKTRSDEDKISGALHRLTAEDCTFKATREQQTRELIVSGMGDLHINLMVNRMKSRFGVEVDMGTPKVAYKEAITAKGESQYRHKKQTGGAGQFAEVWMRVEPLARGGGFEFVDEVVGGAIPKSFIISCEKGVRAAMQSGALAGFPIIDVRAVVYDGKTHPVDSKDIAFQIAARQGFKEACLKAKPVILEPIMDVGVTVPDEFMGDITGSLNSRRGKIMGVEPGEGFQTVKAKVPLEEMYKYVNELKSITGGRGSYAMTFSHYEIVPSNLAQQIIEKAKRSKEAKN